MSCFELTGLVQNTMYPALSLSHSLSLLPSLHIVPVPFIRVLAQAAQAAQAARLHRLHRLPGYTGCTGCQAGGEAGGNSME